MSGTIRSIRDGVINDQGSWVDVGADGLKFRRFLSTPDEDPWETVEWGTRQAVILAESGHVVFEQSDVEAPLSWSDMAVNVVASRYFRGRPGAAQGERSIRAIIHRVVDTIREWGTEQGYFASEDDAQVFSDELTLLLLHQKATFNSPVWFNVGIEAVPQCSACFILSVDDSMTSILDWYKAEGLIFKGGSGSGVNLSRLRSRREPLGGGGTASGPVSFMKAADASAGVIKSGGKTRRAAKMVILDVDHPDILQFIRCKAEEEVKAHLLAQAGYGGSLEGEAYSTVAFQNSNHSVRVSDAFMEADKNDEEWHTRFILTGGLADTHKARDLFREMARAAHGCGDPGIQFHTTINRWHTCPETAPIRASNPCSEYMHVDDSACNLASLRLTAFLDGDGFRTNAFRHAVSIMITAQEILVDKASYPTAAIEKNSRNMRALGLGYADLGALLMERGLRYDSDKGRTWAATITALMTGEAYLQSARLAAIKGSFPEFDKNREAMLGVMGLHRQHVEHIDQSEVPYDLIGETIKVWDRVLRAGEQHGYRNCQATVLAPTGTIAFMMDCDTTGVEPEMALVKYKNLAGGGRLKIVNKTVPRALERLGYSPAVIQRVVERISETGTIEGIEEVRSEHLPIFDCAFRPLKGKRFISTGGHLRMMAAVQPFISGAISKTINVPHETTPEEIEEIFRRSWVLGLKAVSIYRDGCKAVQPVGLTVSSGEKTVRPVRRRLPVDCQSVRHKFGIAGQKGYIHTGFYEDGKVGEIFIRMAKEGSTISGLMDTIATLTSIALQYGVPLEALVNKFIHVRFEPSGFTTNPDIPIAKSLTDYIFRYLGTRFLSKEQQEAAGLVAVDHGPDALTESSSPPQAGEDRAPRPQDDRRMFHLQSDAPACRECGSIMVRRGSCYRCDTGGASNGCS
ncbi:MAG: vitamin B12-dependent ribonucleotide reductase [Deltaproteobacteria bacterium]